MNEKQCREIVRQRSGGVCEVCGRARATNFQHRKNRSQCAKDERWLPSNALDVCGSGTTGCHGTIHRLPSLAYTSGHSVKSGETPSEVPVVLWHGLVLLHDDGGFAPLIGGAA